MRCAVRFIRKTKLNIVIILLAAFLVPFFFPAGILASTGQTKTVKVGYYENEVFEEGASDGAVKTGYAYEYYCKLSEYTGWNYEYVYGGFNDLYDMLLEGDIDLLAGLAKRDDRIGIIGYPADPMGSEHYSLVRHNDDPDVSFLPSSVAGKKIGVLDSAIRDILEEYLKEHSVTAEIEPFDDYESLFTAFDNREVDVLAAEGDGAYGRENSEVICSFGESDYYLCVSIGRNDLLEELEAAQSMLAAEEPDYINSLQSKYYSASVTGHTFSAAEREWLEENTELKVGYLNNYLPYSATGDDGNATGIVKDILPQMFSVLSVPDIDISYTGYDRYDDMIADVSQGRIDACFPVGGGLYYSEESGIYQSTPVVSAATDLVYKDEYVDDDVLHFAVNENNRMQYYYICTNFPDAKISFYPDINACLMAVLKEEAGATTLNGLRANEILKNSRYRGLYLQQLGQADDRCFGVKIGNEGLLKLLNHGIKLLGPEYSLDIAYHYTGALSSYSLSDMIKDNIWLFLIILLIIAGIIIALVVRDLKRTRLANQMKSDFVSNMSHEIRTPITAILGMNEMIQRESNDEAVLAYSDNIEKAGESLLGIINDILDFSKIEAGHMEVIRCPYSLPELLGDLNLMITMRAREKDLQFCMNVDESLPVMPVGDMQKLRQIITNLLTNAVKYTEKGGITLSLKLLSAEEDSFLMEVSVEDTGIGIREDEMDRLYSAFDRLDMEKNRNIEGSGLGLAITQRMLSLMDSEIKVKSTYGEGSRFFFTIKQGISDGTPIGEFEASLGNTGGESRRRRVATFTAPDARLLIVDDTPMNLQVICGLLKGNCMKTDTAQNGEECIRLFGADTYDVVFLDLRMPNMDGVETLQELTKRFPDKVKKTPIISLTANALSGAREQMLKEGFKDYLTKPVNLADMEEMLLKYLPEDKIKKIEVTEPESEYKLPEKLKKIKDIDIEKGLEYCGDEEDYSEALNIFRASAAGKAGSFNKSASEADMASLSLQLHSAKSSLRAIGAMALSELAAKLEAAAGSGDTDIIGEDLAGFIKRYEILGNELDEAME